VSPFLAIILACGSPAPEVEPVSQDVVQTAATTIRACLLQAAELRKQDRRTDARGQVLGCYRAHFEPLEPVLRAHNRRATLSLEYGFGRVASVMGQKGTIGSAQTIAEQLADRVEGVLDSLPARPAPSAPGADTGNPGR